MREMDVLLPRWSNTMALNRNNPTARAVTKSETTGTNQDPSRLKAACRQLEALFIGHLLKEMRATITESGYLDSGRAGKLYTAMLDGELARELSAKGGIGLAELLLEDFKIKTAK